MLVVGEWMLAKGLAGMCVVVDLLQIDQVVGCNCSQAAAGGCASHDV
jgi:hypothetical protein